MLSLADDHVLSQVRKGLSLDQKMACCMSQLKAFVASQYVSSPNSRCFGPRKAINASPYRASTCYSGLSVSKALMYASIVQCIMIDAGL